MIFYPLASTTLEEIGQLCKWRANFAFSLRIKRCYVRDRQCRFTRIRQGRLNISIQKKGENISIIHHMHD